MNRKKNKIIRFLKRKIGNLFFRIFFLQDGIESFLNISPLDAAIDFVINNQVSGDYLEFGVYKGYSFIRAYKRAESLQDNKNPLIDRYIAFDSFQGLPQSKDPLKPKQYKKGAYKTPKQVFQKNLEANNVKSDKVLIVKGWYDKVLNESLKEKHKLNKASVIYIDCDVYESAVPVFDFITELLQQGTVIVIDDWFRHKGSPRHGIQKAYYEWLKVNPNIHTYQLRAWDRVAFIVNKT